MGNLAGERENERKEGVELPSPSAESEHNTVLAFASDNAANDEDIAATKDKKKVKSLSYLSKDAQTRIYGESKETIDSKERRSNVRNSLSQYLTNKDDVEFLSQSEHLPRNNFSSPLLRRVGRRGTRSCNRSVVSSPEVVIIISSNNKSYRKNKPRSSSRGPPRRTYS